MREAQKERNMKEYFECVNCGQVVQGWHASQQIECCESPQYRSIYPDDGESDIIDEEAAIRED